MKILSYKEYINTAKSDAERLFSEAAINRWETWSEAQKHPSFLKGLREIYSKEYVRLTAKIGPKDYKQYLIHTWAETLITKSDEIVKTLWVDGCHIIDKLVQNVK